MARFGMKTLPGKIPAIEGDGQNNSRKQKNEAANTLRPPHVNDYYALHFSRAKASLMRRMASEMFSSEVA